jgi:transposase
VHEKVGAIKAKLSSVGYLYDITYTEDQAKGIVTQLHWKRVQEKEKPKGTYFLRYTDNAIKENKIWDLYNLTRDVESVFRCLKTDLDIRPIYHQKDKYIEPHIWLGILSYQVVNYIKNKLKAQGNNDRWTSIVNKMRSMQASTVVIKDQKEQLIYIKLCTRPTQYQKSVFDILKYKDRPYVRKTKVVTQM